MSLDVKVLFGNLSLVSAPAFFHLEPKHFGWPGYPVNASENGKINKAAKVIQYNPSSFEGN